jgi:lipoate-protein ligase A
VTKQHKILILTTDRVNPWHNLALEEYLMGRCESAVDPDPARDYRAILYLWRNQHTVVIGRNQNAWAECRTGELEADGGYLARRSTGGGAVYHDLGNLNFSIILPRPRFDLGKSFQVILDAALALGLDAVRSGRNDILLDGRKFSGNAFRYLRGVALHHGTLMIDTDVEPLMRYLTVSDAKLKSRAIQSVRSRVINLIDAKPDITVDEVAHAVIDAFIAHYGEGCEIVRKTIDDFERDATLARLEEHYASWAWRYGSTKPFDLTVETGRFPWGQATLNFKVEHGTIADAVIYSDALDSDFIDELSQSLVGVPFSSEAMAAKIEPLGRASETIGDITQNTIARDMAGVLRDRAF